MSLTRRQALSAALGASLGPWSSRPTPARAQAMLGVSGLLDAAHEGLVPGAEDDQSARLNAALQKAGSQNKALFLPPGRYQVAEVNLPRYAYLVGVPGPTQLVFAGGNYMLRAQGTRVLRLERVLIDGAALPIPENGALVEADAVDDVIISDTGITRSTASGVSLRECFGRVENSRVQDVRSVGIALVQSRGMAVIDNVVVGCGDTGILVARDGESSDDTIVRGNRVSAIRADSGGTGQNGNGINISKANGVIVADNRVDDCFFTAVRCFSSDNLQITGNVATRCGEVALYVEFAFEGAIISNNLVDTAGYGISFANFFEHGGRLSVCSGNIIRNITGRPLYSGGDPKSGAGISAEADAAITGNVVENALQGIMLGWGPHLRDVTATGNVVRRCPLGIGVSVAEGAGPAVIANNLVSGADRGAIAGMRWDAVVADNLPASRAEYPHLTIKANRTG